MSGESTTLEHGEQATLLNLEHKSINPYWIDPNQPLIVPADPLHWKAHELQILLEILKKQASKNPAQFNSKNYIDTLDKYTEVITQINKGMTADEILGSSHMAEVGDESAAPAMGARVPAGLGAGISADNPLAR